MAQIILSTKHTTLRSLLCPRLGTMLLLVGLPCLLYWEALFAGRVLLPADLLRQMRPWGTPPQPGQPAEVAWEPLSWDGLAQYYPWREFAHCSLNSGIIPLWNPYQFCGTPFLANAQSALFYPPNVLFWLLPVASAFAISAALHHFLAGWFTYRLLRFLRAGRFGSLVGASSFSLCGFLVAWVHLPTVPAAIVWLPLAWLCLERYFRLRRWREAAWAGGALALSLLAGHPQIGLYLLLASAAYLVARGLARDVAPTFGARATRLGQAGLVMYGLAFCLSAVQLLPTLEFAHHSHRTISTGLEGFRAYLAWAMPWQHLVSLALPGYFGRPPDGTYWSKPTFPEYAAYVGILPLLLAPLALWPVRLRAVGGREPALPSAVPGAGLPHNYRRDAAIPPYRQARFFGGCAAFCLLVALGTPLAGSIFFLPGFARSGGPARILCVYALCLTLLGGLGADRLMRALSQPQGPRRLPARLLAISWAVLAFSLCLFHVVRYLPPVRTLVRPLPAAELASLCVRDEILLALCALALPAGAWAVLRRGLSRHLLAGLLLTLLVLDLALCARGLAHMVPGAWVYPDFPSRAVIAASQAAGQERILALRRRWGLGAFPDAALPPNAATVYGLHDAQGYDSLYLARVRDVLAAAQGGDPSPGANANLVLLRPPVRTNVLRTLGVRHLLSSQALADPALELVYDQEIKVYRLLGPSARAWLTPAPEFITSPGEALARLGVPQRGEHTLALILSSGAGRPSASRRGGSQDFPAAPAGSVSIIAETPNRLMLETSWANPSYLMLADACYPGWQARVDARATPILLANHAFRALKLPPGRHRVTFSYQPTSFRLGLFLTLLGLAATCALAIGGWRGGQRESRGGAA